MRDLLLQQTPKDYDIVTTATPVQACGLHLPCRDCMPTLGAQQCQPCLAAA